MLYRLEISVGTVFLSHHAAMGISEQDALEMKTGNKQRQLKFIWEQMRSSADRLMQVEPAGHA